MEVMFKHDSSISFIQSTIIYWDSALRLVEYAQRSMVQVPILETLMVWQKQTCKQMRNSIVSTGRDMRIKCHKSLWHGVINCLGIDQKVS